MDSSDTREPSYYEVALTNRQVLVAFVVLLTCLLGAFLSGVWVGRGAETVQAVATPAVPSPAADEPVEQLSFFGREPGTRTAARPAGTGTEGTSPARPVVPSGATPAGASAASPETAEPAGAAGAAAAGEDSAAERMRRTIEAEMAAHREPSPAASAPAGAPTPDPTSEPRNAGERARRPSSEPATRPGATPSTASTAAAASARSADVAASPGTARVWIQVYSSSNGERAREIVGQLRSAGFPVVLSEAPKAGSTGAAATTFRVRVGPYDVRPRAEKAAQRLRREHRLDTWVTDAP